MLFREQYNQFMLPFYKEPLPFIPSRSTKALTDTGGQVEPLIPWFLDGSIESILPLEHLADVDANRIRKNFPETILIGGF